MSSPSPVWTIMKTGSANPVDWVTHAPNHRFAVYDPAGDNASASPGRFSDDLVLDRETGLVWARDADLIGANTWLDACTLCRELTLGNRIGWRLPTVEELSSLVDPAHSGLALPDGHPFVNVRHGSGTPAYWTCTNHENPDAAAWFVNFSHDAGPHLAGLATKSSAGHVWPVRGGAAGVNWNW